MHSTKLTELMTRFLHPRPSDRCRFGEQTFAGTNGSDGTAPIPAVPATAAVSQGSTQPV